MKLQNYPVLTGVLLSAIALQAQPQQPTTTTQTAVPRLVRVNSSFHPANGSAPAAVESATLAIYAEETGGTALWQETQNVSVDSDGHYSVLLGSTRNEGLPLDLFASGEPRWLGVQFQRPGEAEQPRVRLASVPYALKAADADTLGGRPLSDFMLADPATASTGSTGSSDPGAAKVGVTTKKAATPKVDMGTLNSIAKFVDGTNDVGNSALFESGGMVGLGTTAPADLMHVRYTNTNGTLTGYAVQNLGNTAASYSGMLFYDQNGALGQFQGFNNMTHEYRINNIALNGSINFMLGTSKFQVRSDGDIDIPQSIRKNGTLFINTLGSSSTGVGLNALANGGSGGNNAAFGVSAMSSTLTNTAQGNSAFGNSALHGLTGGASNSAFGFHTLAIDSTGDQNSAFGYAALGNNTTGAANTAIGLFSMGNAVVTGNDNTAVGTVSLENNTTGTNNVAVGEQAMQNNSTGSANTAVGQNALAANTVTGNNVAVGQSALAAFNSTAGGDGYNIAVGVTALGFLTSGFSNTAVGHAALESSTGAAFNTAIGYVSMLSNITGSSNTALGAFSLNQNTTGSGNVAIAGGGNLTTGSNNIEIGNNGVAGESGVIRIGDGGTQSSFFAAGITGVAVSGVPVVVSSTGQLGVSGVSSRRYKEDIHDMAGASSGLLQLRPVTFRYKQPYADGSKPMEYGLVAEEVAEVYPDLVVFGTDGKPAAVQYQKLAPMLLNEVQKQNIHTQEQDETIRRQDGEIEQLKAEIAALRALVSGKLSNASGQ